MAAQGGFSSPPVARGSCRSLGFTIVELIVSLGVLSVLIGISMPALLGAKKKAHALALLVNQRESLLLVYAYAHDHSGLFPSFGVEQTNIAEVRRADRALALHWWDQVEYWGYYLQSRGYDGWVTLGPGASENGFDSMGCTTCSKTRPAHLLTAAAFGEPGLFSQSEDLTSMHRVQRIDQVSFPADKGLLRLQLTLDGRVPVAFADGHVSEMRESALTPGAPVDMAYSGLAVIMTPSGVRGRDIAPASR